MLTAVVLAKNESTNLPTCLRSLSFCHSVVVVDDFSTDTTVKVAAKFKATILHHSLNSDFAAHRNWAQDHIKSPWLLYVDADETVSGDLASSIQTALANPGAIKGFYIKRLDIMWGRQLNYGDVGNVKLLRLGRRGAGTWSGRVHETWNIEGQTATLSGSLIHQPHPDLSSFLSHLNLYSTIRAQELSDSGSTSNLLQIVFYPLAKFIYLWVFKLGFLDGTPGFIHAGAMAFYSFLVRAKLYFLPSQTSHG